MHPDIAVYAGRPFAAEKCPVSGIGLIFEPVGRSLQGPLIDIKSILDPSIGMGRDIMQRSVYLKLAGWCLMIVCYPKRVGVAHGQRSEPVDMSAPISPRSATLA